MLQIRRGVTALIGGGGKTTLMDTLAEELRGAGSVIVCTSTHIRRPGHLPLLTQEDGQAVRRALDAHGVVCVGSYAEDGKLSAPPLSFETLSTLADYVLVEADGARCRPLKAHADHEPVIPPCAGRVVLVVGSDGFGHPISQVCHRPELYAQRAGANVDACVTPELAARVILAEGYGAQLYINKVETPERYAAAKALARSLPYPAIAGSLYGRCYLCLS